MSKTSILSIRSKTFDGSYRELQLSKLTSVSSYALLVLVAYHWYLRMAKKVAEDGGDFQQVMCALWILPKLTC